MDPRIKPGTGQQPEPVGRAAGNTELFGSLYPAQNSPDRGLGGVELQGLGVGLVLMPLLLIALYVVWLGEALFELEFIED